MDKEWQFEEEQPCTEQAGQHRALTGPGLSQDPREGIRSTALGTDAGDPVQTPVLTHIHPECPQDSRPTPNQKSACPCPPRPSKVQLWGLGGERGGGGDKTGKVGRFLPATRGPRGDALLPVRPSPAGPPEPGALHLPAMGHRARFAARGVEPGGGAEARRAAPCPPARCAPDLPPGEGLGEGGALAGALGPSGRPAPLPAPPRFPRPPSPPRPLCSQARSLPAAAGWAPQKPCAAASLFGAWPFFNSQHTQRIQLE